MAKNKEIVIQGDREQLPALYHENTDLVKGLDEDIVEGIVQAVKAGLSPNKACAILQVGESTFKEWYESGKALYGQYNHPSIPNLHPRQLDETQEEYKIRESTWLTDCDLRVKLYLGCNASESEISLEMLQVMKNYALAEEPDSWKAADKLHTKINGEPARERGVATDGLAAFMGGSDPNNRHAQQVGMMLGNVIGSAIQNLSNKEEEKEEEESIIIEAN